MKNNTFKRVLAGSLALLTVAAYVPANVGGILPDLSIVASAANIPDYETDTNYVQAGGTLRIADDSVDYIEGLYAISTDAGKYVYTKVSGTNIFVLEKDKAYVLWTKAYMTGTGLTKQTDDKDLNGNDLPSGVYEYTIGTQGANDTLVATTLKAIIQKQFTENPTITQNGKEIKYDDDAAVKGYVVAQGFPVEVSAKPDEANTDLMLALDDANEGTVKAQTKASDTTLTMTFVPKDVYTNASLVNNTVVEVKFAAYAPTLELTANADGTVTATDIGFEALVSNAVVGEYVFDYMKGNVTADVNSKGAYIADGSTATAKFTAKSIKVNNKTYNFLVSNTVIDTVEKKQDDGTWSANKPASEGGAAYTVADTDQPGTYRVTTNVTATSAASLTENPFKIVTEFTVVEQAVTGDANLAFMDGQDTTAFTEIVPQSNGVYNVPVTGKEIAPKLYLFKNTADKTTFSNTVKTAGFNTNLVDTECYVEGTDYTVTGTTKASDAGIYTMTITPIKNKFNDGEPITITWQIVNTNNYVELKTVPTVSGSAYDGTNADVFTIGYRQASKDSIVQKIVKSLNFVGSQDLQIVKYTNVAGTTEYDDPSENAGTYVAYVANYLKNDGKTSAMMKDQKVYNGTNFADVKYIDATTGLVKICFTVEKTKIVAVPDVTEITYGDDVKINTLYKLIDNETKDEIGVPWAVEPKIKSDDTAINGATSTKALPAGEYTYVVTATPLDTNNYEFEERKGNDKIKFTVNARDLSDIDFGTVNVEIVGETATIDATKLAVAANEIEANPVAITAADIQISSGVTSKKASEVGKTFTVNIKGKNNFTGTKAVQWIVGGSVLNDNVMSYEAQFDASKPRVTSKFDVTKVDGEIEECGFYYNNNGKMNDIPLDGYVRLDTGAAVTTDTEVAAVGNQNITRLADLDALTEVERNANGFATAQQYAQELFKQVDKSGANMNQKGAKKVSFSQKAVTTAKSGNGLLTAEIANSSVKKQVYIMPYVKYKNGNIAYGKVESFNYYDMVLAAEGALEVTKTDVVGDGKVGTAGQTYVKVDVTRVDKQGYEVERYGILYNNSDSWNQAGSNAKDAKTTAQEIATAYNWLSVDHESEKTVKVAEVPAADLATKIGTNTYIANSLAKKVDGNGKETGEYGFGAKSVFARAFIKIKDAAGNEKVYYSHIADVTYGGFTVNATTGVINGVENATGANAAAKMAAAVTDSKAKDQILFYAPTGATVRDEGVATTGNSYKKNLYQAANAAVKTQAYEADKDGVKFETVATDANVTRMATSTGNKTFFVDWTDSKKS